MRDGLASRCYVPARRIPYKSMKLQRIVFVLVMAVMLFVRKRRIPRPEIRESSFLSLSRFHRCFPGPLGFDVEGTRPGISLVVGAPPGRWTMKAQMVSPLGKRATGSPELRLSKWPPHFRFLPRGEKNVPTIWSSKERLSGICSADHDRARRTSWRWIGQPALLWKGKVLRNGETNSVVQRKRFDGMER